MNIWVPVLGLGMGVVAFGEQPSSWWESFENDVLSGWVEEGLAAHPDPTAALAEVKSARYQRDRAAAAGGPTGDLKLALRGGREKTMYSGREVGTIDPVAGSVTLSWELDLFGKVKHATKAAAARGEMSVAELRGVRLLLGVEIARQVFEAALLRDTAVVESEVVDVAGRLEARIRSRVEAGLAAQGELDRAEARRHMAEHAHAQTEVSLAQSLNRISSLVGMPLATDQLPRLTDMSLPPALAFEKKKQVQGRPDVMAAWWRLQGVVSDAERAKRARAPTFALVASAAGEADSEGAEPWRAWVGPTVQLPLWRPDLKADSRRAQAEAEAAQANFESVALAALREIEDARIRRTHAEEMMGHAAERHAVLVRASASEHRKRQAGLIQEDVLQGARVADLEAARGALVWRKYALMAQLDLIKALGGD